MSYNVYGRYKMPAEDFEAITAGLDIRQDIRDSGLCNDEREIRLAAAIRLVLYRHFPAALTEEEISDIVTRDLYVLMEDGAFKAVVNDVKSEKWN